MPYQDKKMYKNPRLPKAADLQTTQGGDVGASATRDRREPVAPQRAGGGMLKMAAQARSRQPKAGAPPIPTGTTAATSPVGTAPTTAPGAMVDPRAAAAKALADKATAYGPKAMGSGGQPPPEPPHQEPSLPGGPQPFDPAQPKNPNQGLPSQPPPSQPQEEPVLPDGYGEAPGPSSPLDPSPHAEQKHADQSQETAAGPTQTETPTSPEEVDWGAVEKLTESKKAAQKLAEQKEKEEAELKAIEEARHKQMAEEGGYQSTQQAKLAAQTEATIMDYLGQTTGIPPEELQGQIAGLQAAGYDQMAKFAQQMAARGMGTSGLAGQGMGQIMTQTMLGIANLKFENSKLALEERMNKMKNFMAFYGNVMSEANKTKHLEEMAALERDKFDYDKAQNALSDKWVAVKNILALAGSEKWDTDALGWAFRAIEAGADPALITEWISNDGKTVSLKPGAPEYPGIEEGQIGPPPEGGSGFGEGSASPKNNFPDYLSDEQYQEYFELGQVPSELGWKDASEYPDGYLGNYVDGLHWKDMSGAEKTMAMGVMQGVNKGWPKPPPGWQDKYPDKKWGADTNEADHMASWWDYVTEGGTNKNGLAIWIQITGHKEWWG